MGGPAPPWPRSSATTPQKKPFFVRRRPGSSTGAGLVDEDAIRPAQMGPHVVDDRHQVEAGAADPVAERAAIDLDPLPPEDPGLAIEWQMVAELRDDDPGDEQFRGQPAGHNILGRMRLRDGLRAAATGVFGPSRHQHPELGRDHGPAARTRPPRSSPSHRGRGDIACSRARSPARPGAARAADARGYASVCAPPPRSRPAAPLRPSPARPRAPPGPVRHLPAAG